MHVLYEIIINFFVLFYIYFYSYTKIFVSFISVTVAVLQQLTLPSYIKKHVIYCFFPSRRNKKFELKKYFLNKLAKTLLIEMCSF